MVYTIIASKKNKGLACTANVDDIHFAPHFHILLYIFSTMITPQGSLPENV